MKEKEKKTVGQAWAGGGKGGARLKAYACCNDGGEGRGRIKAAATSCCHADNKLLFIFLFKLFIAFTINVKPYYSVSNVIGASSPERHWSNIFLKCLKALASFLQR